jgi:hypothetical protein
MPISAASIRPRAAICSISPRAAECGAACPALMLETGPLQDRALALYERCGYRRRPPFGDYADDPFSVFMEKPL